MNLADELDRQARATPETVALHSPTEKLDFRELDARVWRAAAFLQRHAIGPGDTVALGCTSETVLLVMLLSLARIGATAFSPPRGAPAVVCAEMARRAHARIFISDTATTDDAGLPRLCIEDGTFAGIAIDSGIRDPAPTAPWLVIAGSGSTGHPKLFAASHAQFFARTRLAAAMLGLAVADRFATLSHLDFTSPKERCLAALFAGATVVLFDRRRTGATELCRDHGVTVLDATVVHVEQLLDALPAGTRNHLTGLRALQLSASTVSDGLRRRILTSLTSTLHVRYGTNETGPLSCVGPDGIMAVPGGVGRFPAEVRIEIVDAAGQPVPDGQAGLIRVHSPGMVEGYLDDASANTQAFRDDGFLPGDIGRFAPNGHLIFCGRADQMMIMNGINIYPAEIENALSLHPAVRDVAAFPLHSPIHQDIPVCAVALRPDVRAGERDLLAFARQRLGAHAPRRIMIFDKIPRNEQGKPMRAQLAARFGRPRAITPDSPAGTPVPSLLRNVVWLRPPRQALRQTWLRFRCPDFNQMTILDDWFAMALRIPLEPLNMPLPSPWKTGLVAVADFAWRMLLLYRVLLQESRIPAFDPGGILDVRRDAATPDGWLASVAVVRLENVSLRCHALASAEAVKLVVWMAEHPRNTDNTAILFAMLEKDALRPLRRLAGGNQSSLHVLRAAHARDIPFFPLGGGVYLLGWGSKARRIDRSTTAGDPAIAAKLTQNKVWSANLMRTAGLPAPRHAVAATPEEALRAAHRLGWPVVVKPVDRDRGEGVTVGVADASLLAQAVTLARNMSRTRQVIIEREVPGVCHRLFIAHGRLLYAVKRLPKSVHGDGRHTVAELIRTANRETEALPPWRRTERYPDDDMAAAAIAAMGYSFDTVPAAGERISLRAIESTAWGGFDEEVTDRIHPDNLDIVLRAAELFELEVAGVDIITPDIALPWHANGAIINEVNYAPLLGGGEISRRHVPEFVARLVDGDGRIPVEGFVGGAAALIMARDRQEALVAASVRCFMTSHATTLAPTGEEMHFPFASLRQRCHALLLDRRVEALVLAIQTDELLHIDLPVDRFSRVTASGEALLRTRKPSDTENLLALLRAHEAGLQRLAAEKAAAAVREQPAE